jgi:hypothetical protein
MGKLISGKKFYLSKSTNGFNLEVKSLFMKDEPPRRMNRKWVNERVK